MSLSRRARILVKSAALWTGVAVAVLCIALAGLGFLVTGLFILVARHTDYASASAITGSVLLLLAVAIGLIGGAVLKRIRTKQPSMLSEFGGTIGLAGRLIGILVRRDPKKAIIISIIAGALAEYIASDGKQ
ncbi:MAG TPA: hypothetical protein VMV54_08620 [Acidocella sp.]|nr:hypothetical protein [Acidocella sp.]